ncbi:MAG: alkaline phosphatase [Planctomycetes bacterium]|nr:alkaline phosphatase [Planctomycetota bacterium]
MALLKSSGPKTMIAVLFCMFAVFALAGETNQNPVKESAKNIIVFISDGCGQNHIGAADLWQYGKTGMQAYEKFAVKLFMSTFSKDGFGYDPASAWSDFNHVKIGATDSAAAATAMSTGIKTSDGRIGMDEAGNALYHIFEGAEKLGKATGVVTSVELSHATPAGFAAHNQNRSHYREIAEEMIERSPIDLIMGTGHPLYDNSGVYGYNQDTDGDGIPDKHQYQYVGGIKTWARLISGEAGTEVDADHNGMLDDSWTLIQSREAFRALADGLTPKRVIGVPRVHATLQQSRAGDGHALPYAVPATPSVPTLAEMTRAALNVLDNDRDGFFLMVEGGAVDWASHANQSGRMIEDEIEFNAAVDAAIAWARSNDAWDETLIIVTGDHECGYLTRIPLHDLDTPWSFEPLRNEGPGILPDMQWNSGSHTNSLIPLFAGGAGARLFEKQIEGHDPRLGDYVDNTAIARVVFTVMGL